MDKVQAKREGIKQDKKIKKPRTAISRINIIRMNDNKIMVDIMALEMLVADKLIDIYNGANDDLCNVTLIAVKETLSNITETAIQRIQEQNATSTKYQNNTIKEIELDTTKLFKY